MRVVTVALGLRLTMAREARGLFRAELARRVGIDQWALKEIEDGAPLAPGTRGGGELGSALHINPKTLSR